MAYSYKRSITIDYTKCGTANSTDFPVLVSFTDASFKTVANGGKVQNSNGYDIAFYSDSGLTTALFWEIEKYTATTGECIFWVKVPTLSYTTNTVIYIAYGDSSISTFQSTATSVWNSNYKGVYHLPNGSTLNLNDSTSNANNGTNNGITAATGKIDGGANNNGSSWISTGTSSSLKLTNLTLSGWVKTSAAGSLFGGANYVTYSHSKIPQIYWDGTSSHKLSLIKQDVAIMGTSTGTFGTGWTHIAVTYNYSNGNMEFFINGASAGTATYSTTWDYTNMTLWIGARGNGNPVSALQAINGDFDEVRYNGSVLSSSWILSEYNNQNSPSTFFTLGSETPVAENTTNFFNFM